MSKLVSAVKMEKGTLEEVLSGTYEVFKGSEIYDIELHEGNVLFKIKKDKSKPVESTTYEEMMKLYNELNDMRINLKRMSQDYNKLITNYENSNYQLKNLQTLIKSKDDVIGQLKSESKLYKWSQGEQVNDLVNQLLNSAYDVAKHAEEVKSDNKEQLKLNVDDLTDELRAMLWVDAIKKGGI